MNELTLDEVIKHYLEAAEEQSGLYSLCPCPCDGTKNCMCLKNGKDMGCTKLAAEYRQLAEWLTELKEAKRLLKVAMEDMKILYETGKDEGCIGIEFKWRYADEVLKLLNDVNIKEE